MVTKQVLLPSVLIALFLGFTNLSQTYAQMTEGQARFGLKLGITGSNLYDDSKAANHNGRVGLVGSAFVKIPLDQRGRFSLRPELLFATKGATYTRDSFVSSLKSAYLELPVSLEYNLFSFINLHAGVNASYLASSNGLFKDEQGNPINFDKDDLEKVDFGFHIGAGLDFGNIGLHFRINRGLKDVGGQSLGDLVGSLKNSAWALTFAYGF
ncbi:MAG: porin family protein [Saprospiraceae bacterium]